MRTTFVSRERMVVMTSSAKSLSSMYQVVALTLTYRKIVETWSFLPVRLGVYLPIVGVAMFSIVNFLSGGFAIFAFSLFILLLMMADMAIWRLSTSETARKKAIDAGELRLWLWSFLVSCIVTRFGIAPIYHTIGIQAWYPSYKTFILQTLRLARTTALLGGAVVVRYIGPKSIMRCSSVPLVTNPIDDAIQTFWKNKLAVLQPSDRPGELIASPYSTNAISRGRRFQHPTWSAIVAQVLFAIVIGASVAWLSDMNDRGEEYSLSVLVVSSAVSVAGPLMRALDFRSHELDPTRVQLRTTESLRAMMIQAGMWTVVGNSIVLVWHFRGVGSLSEIWHLRNWSLYCFFFTFYVCLVDEDIKYRLVSPQNLIRIVQQAVPDLMGDVHETTVDVVMKSLVYDESLVRELMTTDCDEEREMARIQKCHTKIGQILLSPAARFSEAPLEEDVLRLSILEYFGGASNAAVVEEWFSLKPSLKEDKPTCLLLLLRAFAAYAGGMGDALLRLQRPLKHTSVPTRVNESWALSPGFLVSVELVVNALSDFIVRSMADKRDWKQSDVAVTVWSVVSSILKLRKGLVSIEKGPSTLVVDKTTAQKLILCCERGAQSINGSLALPQGFGQEDTVSLMTLVADSSY